MVSQLKEDLVHLEGRDDGLYEDGRPHRAVRYGQCGLSEGETSRPALAKYSAKSTSLAEPGCPSTRMWRSSKCHPRGRTTIVGLAPATVYRLPPGLAKLMVRLTASSKLHRPLTIFSHVGTFVSSKSASQMLAPN